MKRGFSIVEVLVYTAIFVVALSLLIGTALGLSRSYGSFGNQARLERDAVAVLERLTREARAASSVDTAASTLGVNPSVLALATTDAALAARTVQFFVFGGALHMKENGADMGALTSGKTNASVFIVRRIATGRSEAVKVELALQTGEGAASTTKRFYATTILRNSY